MYGVVRSQCATGLILRRMLSSALPPREIEKLAYTRAWLLAHALKCPPSFTLQLVSRNELFITQDWKHLENSITFVGEKLDFKNVLKNYEILLLDHGSLEQRYEVLQEIGVVGITSRTIKMYPKIVSLNVMELQRDKYISQNSNPLDRMLKNLKCDQQVKDSIREKVAQQKDKSVKAMRWTVLVNFLCWKLDCPEKTILSFLKGQTQNRINSFLNLQATLDIMFEEFKIPLKKVQKYPCFLNVTKNHLRKILNNSFLLEAGIVNIIQSFPPIMRTSIKKLQKNIECLRLHQITNEQIYRCREILFLSSETILKRLEDVNCIPEMQAMKLYPRFLQLVYRVEKAKKQLEVLKSAGYMAISLNRLLSANLDDHITAGKDSCMGNEFIVYAAHIFGKSHKEIREKLKCHWNMHRISILNGQTMIEAFLGRGVSKEQLWNSLYIVLYDYNMVIDLFVGLEDRPELQPYDEWRNHPLLLDVIVYFIEKDTGFNGAGVFCKSATNTSQVAEASDEAED